MIGTSPEKQMHQSFDPLSFHTEKEDWAPPWICSGEAEANFKILASFGEIKSTKIKHEARLKTKQNKDHQRSYHITFTTCVSDFEREIV